MTERGLTDKIMLAAKQELRGCKVIKHSERSTIGVPDLSISWMGFSNWVENKYRRKGESLKDICKMQQLVVCHELETTSRCFIALYEDDPKRLTLWSPRALASHIWPRVVGQAQPTPPEVVAWDEPVNLFRVLGANGGVRCAGWEHRFVTKMIKDHTRAS